MTRSTSSTVVCFGSMSSATTVPRRMTTMRSTTWKTWWMLCAMKMQEWPESRAPRTKLEHALRLGDAEIVGRLVEDDQVAVEIHGAGDRDRLALAARQRADRRRRRDVLGDADPSQQFARDRVHRRLVHAVEEARPLHRLAAEEQVARDRELRDQRRILVDRLDAVARSRRSRCGSRPSRRARRCRRW